jgi:hypothetical protein
VTSVEDLERRYHPNVVDEHELFDRMIRASLQPDIAVLDVGAGRGLRFSYDYKDHVARIAGADVDESVPQNPNLMDAVVADLSNLPLRRR